MVCGARRRGFGAWYDWSGGMTEITREEIAEAIRIGCNAADVHMICSYPECTCKQIPAAVQAALASRQASDAIVDSNIDSIARRCARGVRGCATNDQYTDLIERISEALRMALASDARGWRPIVEAPKDGTRLLLAATGWISIGYYAINLNGDETDGWTDGSVESWKYEEYRFVNPTHFMPLPAPPADEENKT